MRNDLVPARGVPVQPASLMAASFASAPLLQKKHWPPNDRSERAWANAPCASMYQVFGTWISWPDLLADRLDDPRRAVAQQVAAPAGEEIEVAVAPRRPRSKSLRP